jgi:uncharacterized RDD family membrane protein YckC
MEASLRNFEIIDAEKLHAPFLLRCGALVVDYILIILIPVMGLIIARLYGNDGTRLFKSQVYDFSLFIASLIIITNLVILPAMCGQSVGKMLTGLRIVTKKGKRVGYKRVIVRNFLGYLITILTFGLGFLICAFDSQGRALHDFLAKTVVIRAIKHRV